MARFPLSDTKHGTYGILLLTFEAEGRGFESLRARHIFASIALSIYAGYPCFMALAFCGF